MRLLPIASHSICAVTGGLLALTLSSLLASKLSPKSPIAIKVAPGESWSDACDCEDGVPLDNYGLTNFGVSFTSPSTGLYTECPVLIYLRDKGTLTGLVLPDGSCIVIQHENGLIKSAHLCQPKPTVWD